MLSTILAHPLIVSGVLLPRAPLWDEKEGDITLMNRLKRLEVLSWVSRCDRIFTLDPSMPDRLARSGFTFDRQLVVVDDGSPLIDSDRMHGEVAHRIWGSLAERWDERSRGFLSLRSRIAHPRLAVVGPCPPSQEDAAWRTAAYAAALASHATVDVYTATPDPAPIPGVRVVAPLTDLPYQPSRYDDVITVVGDPGAPDDGLDQLFRLGGAALLSRHHLIDHYLARESVETVAERLSRRAGRSVVAGELLHLNRLKNAFPDPMLTEILSAAHPLIISGHPTPAFLPPSVAGRPDLDLRFVPPFPRSPTPRERLTPAQRQEARARLGWGEDAIELVSFGPADESQGADCCIWAVQSLRAWNRPVRLTFVGPETPLTPSLRGLLKRIGLEEQCRFIDAWPDSPAYTDYLCAADAAIQLQTYDFGLVSDGLLACIAAGLPVVTNAAQATAAEAPSYCLTVPDHLSPVLTAEAVLTVLERGLHQAERDSPERADYLNRCNPDRTGRAVLEALGYTTVTA